MLYVAKHLHANISRMDFFYFIFKYECCSFDMLSIPFLYDRPPCYIYQIKRTKFITFLIAEKIEVYR